jgi:hypothetical protein
MPTIWNWLPAVSTGASFMVLVFLLGEILPSEVLIIGIPWVYILKEINHYTHMRDAC